MSCSIVDKHDLPAAALIDLQSIWFTVFLQKKEEEESALRCFEIKSGEQVVFVYIWENMESASCGLEQRKWQSVYMKWSDRFWLHCIEKVRYNGKTFRFTTINMYEPSGMLTFSHIAVVTHWV